MDYSPILQIRKLTLGSLTTWLTSSDQKGWSLDSSSIITPKPKYHPDDCTKLYEYNCFKLSPFILMGFIAFIGIYQSYSYGHQAD